MKTVKLMNRKEIEEYCYYKPELDLDKVQTIEDCKKLLKFIYECNFQPIQKGRVYRGFKEVKEYFKGEECNQSV